MGRRVPTTTGAETGDRPTLPDVRRPRPFAAPADEAPCFDADDRDAFDDLAVSPAFAAFAFGAPGLALGFGVARPFEAAERVAPDDEALEVADARVRGDAAAPSVERLDVVTSRRAPR